MTTREQADSESDKDSLPDIACPNYLQNLMDRRNDRLREMTSRRQPRPIPLPSLTPRGKRAAPAPVHHPLCSSMPASFTLRVRLGTANRPVPPPIVAPTPSKRTCSSKHQRPHRPQTQCHFLRASTSSPSMRRSVLPMMPLKRKASSWSRTHSSVPRLRLELQLVRKA